MSPRAFRSTAVASFLVVAGILSQACSAKTTVASDAGVSESPDAETPVEPRPDAGPDAGRPMIPNSAAVGNPCKTGATAQGTCPSGLLCAPAPGGLCTALCALVSCGASAVCAESIRGGEICLRSCKRDADCRAGEGYFCDPVVKGCTLPALLPPPAPACAPVTTLPRKRFGKPVQLTNAASPGRYQFEPSAALSSTGDLSLAYINGPLPGEANSLGIARITANGATSVSELKTPLQRHFDPWMASDRGGARYLVWLGLDSAAMGSEVNMQIGFSRRDSTGAGETGTVPIPVHDAADCPDAPNCLDKPMIAIGPNPQRLDQDIVHVFYASEPGGGLRTRRSLDLGKTFEPSVLVDPFVYGDARVSGDGVLHVVYTTSYPGTIQSFGSTQASVIYLRSVDGGKTFTKPVGASGATESIPFYFSNPQVASDPTSKAVYVVYPAGTPDGRWDIMLAVSKDDGATFVQQRINDDPACANHMTPAIALDPVTRRIHLMWTENRGGVGRVSYAECGPLGTSCQPNESVSDTPFASYSFVRHSRRWLGEYNALVLDPARRRLHAVWTQTVLEDGEAVSRIFHAAGSLP